MHGVVVCLDHRAPYLSLFGGGKEITVTWEPRILEPPAAGYGKRLVTII
jgi:hypothetical protein